jgi:CheY-like chemotaxis protein
MSAPRPTAGHKIQKNISPLYLVDNIDPASQKTALEPGFAAKAVYLQGITPGRSSRARASGGGAWLLPCMARARYHSIFPPHPIVKSLYMPNQARTVLAVMTDLFFSSRINDTAKKFGMTTEFVKDKETALTKARLKPSVVIFDLNCDAAEPVDVIRQLKEDPETRRVSTIGFVSHVQTDLKLQAQQAGCDMVVPRSVFAQNLPAIMKRHATIDAGGREE